MDIHPPQNGIAIGYAPVGVWCGRLDQCDFAKVVALPLPNTHQIHGQAWWTCEQSPTSPDQNLSALATVLVGSFVAFSTSLDLRLRESV